jgi:hypothetical protein
MDDAHRRALRNGVVAFALTAVAGFGLNALVATDTETSSAGPSTAPSTPPPCDPSWSALAGPDVDSRGTQLAAVIALGEDDIWVFGSSGTPDEPGNALTARWDGRTWSAVRGPNGGTVTNELLGASASDAHDLWAVGSSSSGGPPQPLIVRSDGSMEWEVVPGPVLPLGGALEGVAAVSEEDAWAVGTQGDVATGEEQALLLRWDGSAWNAVRSDMGGGRTGLTAVSALAPDDVWAVGYHHNRPATIHFDGERWTSVPFDGTGALDAVAPLGPDDVWAAGDQIWHFDGHAWSPVQSIRRGGRVDGLVASGADDVWAVGSTGDVEAARALVLHFDGDRWRPAGGQRVPGGERLAGAALAPDGTLWAVGARNTAASTVTFVVRAEGCG